MSTNPKLTLTALITILCATPAAAQQLLAPSGHAAALLPDKTIVVMGGDGGSNGIPTTKAIYFPAGSDVAVQAGSLVLPRTDHTAVSMYDGRILVVGGNDGYGGMESLEIFDPSTMTFTLSKAVLSAPRQECRAIGLADGRVLIRGGYDRDVKVTLDEIYDPRTDTVTVAPAGLSFASIKTDRYEYLPGDTVYVSGSGFAPGENVDLLFDEDPLVHVPATYSSVADQNGAVTDWATYHVDLSDFGTAFTLHAAGASSGLTSTALFADGANLHGTAIPNTVTIPAGGSASIQVAVYYTGSTITPGTAVAFTNVTVTQDTASTGWSAADSSTTAFTVYGSNSDQGSPVMRTINITAASNAVASGTIKLALQGSAGPSTSCNGGACTASVTITVNLQQAQSQTISFAAIPSKNYGDDFSVTATASSGLPVTFTATGNCTVSTSPSPAPVHLTGVGSCTVTAHQAGGTSGGVTYSAATDVSQSFTINARPLTVTADSGQTKVYGAADPTLTYQITSGSLVGSDALSGSLSRASGENVGSYAITQGTLTAGSNYNLTFVPATFNITARPITVTADSGRTKVYGAADPTLTYQITSGSLVGSDALSGGLSRASGENVGSYAINQGTLTAGSNYNLTFVPATFNITARPITVTADSGQTKVYGVGDPTLTYQITSGSLVGSDGFTGALGRVAGESVGTYAITQGTLTAGSNYNLTFVPATFSIAPRPITVTADAKSKVYGNIDPALTYEVTVGALVGTDVFTGSLTRDPGNDVGTYAIKQGTLTAGSNYNLTYVGASLTITTRAISITADNQEKIINAPDPTLTFHYTVGSLEIVAGDSFTGALIRAAGENAGLYAITQGTLALSANYALTVLPGTLKILYAVGTCFGEPGHAVLQPITDKSVFKIGRTVPVKFRVCDVNGQSVGPYNGLTPSSGLYNLATYSGTASDVNVLTTDSTTKDTDFRWDPTAQQWIFNFDTGDLPHTAATYNFGILLRDKTWITFQFGVK